MKKYYFERYFGTCKTKCMVKNDGTMIGSVKCQICDHCKDHDKEGIEGPEWIICEKLNEALGKSGV